MIPNFNNTSNLSTHGPMNTGTRRYSMVNYGQHYNPNKMNTPGNLFQTLGTGVVRILIIYELERLRLV